METEQYEDSETNLYDRYFPMPENWIYPRLFKINNDNTGYELLNQEQLDLFFSISK